MCCCCIRIEFFYLCKELFDEEEEGIEEKFCVCWDFLFDVI